MSLQIRGIGTAVPPHSIDQRHAAELAKAFCGTSEENLRLVPALYRCAGVRRRHSVVLEPVKPAIASKSTEREAARDIRHDATTGTTVKRKVAVDDLDVEQSFYRPMTSADDCGPTTAERMQMYERLAGKLAAQAAARAIESSRIPTSSVTHLITVSCTGFGAPGADLQIIDELGLSAQTARTHVGFMGCHGALNALRVARAFCDADPESCALICAVELSSLHHQYGWHPEQIVANALFADGSAALVGTKGGDRDDQSWRVIANGSAVLDDSKDAMTWNVRDHGFEMTLSPRVPDIICAELRPWLASWLKQYDLTIEQIGSWAIHPGGPRILIACAESIGLDRPQMAPSHQILADYGNMSSPTVMFILDRLMQSGASRPCVMLAFGPGLAVEAALVC